MNTLMLCSSILPLQLFFCVHCLPLYELKSQQQLQVSAKEVYDFLQKNKTKKKYTYYCRLLLLFLTACIFGAEENSCFEFTFTVLVCTKG